MKQSPLQAMIDMQLAGVLSSDEIELACFLAETYGLDTVREAITFALVELSREAIEEVDEDDMSDREETVNEIVSRYEDVSL